MVPFHVPRKLQPPPLKPFHLQPNAAEKLYSKVVYTFIWRGQHALITEYTFIFAKQAYKYASKSNSNHNS